MGVNNFWSELPKPIFALAPMADVTDAAFRRIIAKYSKVGHPMSDFVMYTEFVSADGLALAPEEGRAKLMRDLLFSEAERPIVAQFFTATPAHMEAAAALAAELGFDGVDINMGCPVDEILRQGCGAELIQHPALAQELIAAAKRGAPGLPVSVKTRLGYHKDVLEEPASPKTSRLDSESSTRRASRGGWLPVLLKAEPAAVIIHARTCKEMSKVPAHWERIGHAVEIRDQLGSNALIIGNGDLRDIEDARRRVKESGADGAMFGRAVFGNPWLFKDTQGSPLERLRVAVEHAQLFEELLGDVKNFSTMRKSLTSGYCQGFPGAKELRVELMDTTNATQVERVIENFLNTRYAVRG